ncbi:hypothetical protein [Brevundimonas balnearis]|uniref:Uncharacterized protein n=1 Tax=Brevundimonas balnearis TaxID=1572858 RepID=A0ABV6R5C8_9CAUL
MQNSFRYVTAPERRFLPRTALGWLLLIGGAILVVPSAVSVIVGLIVRDPSPGAPLDRPSSDAPRQADQEAPAAAPLHPPAELEAPAAIRSSVEEFQFSAAQRALANFKASLRDPYTARFRDVWAVSFSLGELDGGVGVCGIVNARNSFGAYVGEQPFAAMGAQVFNPGDPDFERYFRIICLDGERLFELEV